MEAAGAVFLPAAGFRVGTDARDVGYYGDYWTSTIYNERDAHYLSFSSRNLQADYNYYRYCGFSVRPVR